MLSGISNFNFNFRTVGIAFKGLGGSLKGGQDFTPEKADPFYFKSSEAAAIHWGKQYNSPSIIHNRELAGVIYSVTINNKIWFSYNTPWLGTMSTSNHNRKTPKGTKKAKLIHSHGGFLDPKNDNYFSEKDFNVQTKEGIDSYMASPNGNLQVLREGQNYASKYGDPICECLGEDPRYEDGPNRGKIYWDNFEFGSNRDLSPTIFFSKPPDIKVHFIKY